MRAIAALVLTLAMACHPPPRPATRVPATAVVREAGGARFAPAERYVGHPLVIDFWASWCKPCRMEMPNVKRVYDQYKTKGFEIIGVSLDREKGAWTGAIAQDGLPWKHVSDLGFWNNAAAQQYGVSSIPYTVLVDKDGKVLGKNLRGPALEEKLAEVFK